MKIIIIIIIIISIPPILQTPIIPHTPHTPHTPDTHHTHTPHKGQLKDAVPQFSFPALRNRFLRTFSGAGHKEVGCGVCGVCGVGREV